MRVATDGIVAARMKLRNMRKAPKRKGAPGM
jgi:hypothetical protein